jgi:esterase/lipase
LLFPGADYSDQALYDVAWVDGNLPCTIYPNFDQEKPITRLLMYFHGNAEDATMAVEFIKPIMKSLEAHAVLVEYPTYGYYKSCKDLTQERIYSDSVKAYEYFKTQLKLSPKQIIICGRSIGSGASSHLASEKDSLGFILISPLSSVNKVVLDKIKQLFSMTWVFWVVLTIIFSLLGLYHSYYWLAFLGFIYFGIFVLCVVLYCSLKKFKNIQKIKKIHQPTLIIHGKDDEVIDSYHSELLIEKSPAMKKKAFFFENMTHNQIYPDEHLETPISSFFGTIPNERFNQININKILG